MARACLAVLFLVLVSVPAHAKSRDFYPVSCEDLWAAVNLTLSGPDYRVGAVNDVQQRVSFIVIGHYTTYTDHVKLAASANGCSTRLNFVQIGPENSDERVFMKRLRRSVAQIEAAKAPAVGVPARDGLKSPG